MTTLYFSFVVVFFFALPPPSLLLSPWSATMSFAMTANFFYAIVIVGVAYNLFVLYGGASAAKLALLRK